MEYLSGPTLRDELAQAGRLSLERVRDILTPICDALQLAHDRGVVHRDLKPANIVGHKFDSGALVYKVIDFGLAGLFSSPGPTPASPQSKDDTRLTAAFTFLGTVAYAAPEQFQGQTLDSRADVYAMGVVAYEMLTGRVPFGGPDTMAIIGQHLTVTPPPPSQFHPGLPDWVDRAVLTALTKSPQDRFARVTDFARAIAGAPGRGGAPPLKEDRATTIVHDATTGEFALPALQGLLGKYELGRRLGSGRLGSEVYAAVHRAMGIPVAIRTLRRTADPRWDAIRNRFLLEARALQIVHPSILQVRDFGEEPNLVYVVTDLFEGVSLRERLAREGAIPWPVLSRFVSQLADAAAAIRKRTGSLCGVSPEIIRVTKSEDGPGGGGAPPFRDDDRLLISTAGICQIQDLLATLDEQTLRGSQITDPELPYVAPEVLMGKSPDDRADVYTIGLLSYEMATARRPFVATTMPALIGAATAGPPADPRTVQPEIPEEASALILRCLASNPAGRPATARDFMREWHAITKGKT
jgi:serine/threonine protein kinase